MTLFNLFPGDMGITQTVNALVYAVKFAVANHPELRARAESVVASCPERDEYCEISKIFNWTLGHFRYVNDPSFLEHITSPELLEAQIVKRGQFQGDCDDVSGYLAALLISIGYRVRFVVIAVPGKGDPYRHIYPQVLRRQTNSWLTLEATARTRPMGWEAAHGRIAYYPVN